VTHALCIVTPEEIIRLYKRFLKLDADGSGTISREEFMTLPAIGRNPLAKRLFDIFDEDGGGTVDFVEFIKGLSAFSKRGQNGDKLKCKPSD